MRTPVLYDGTFNGFLSAVFEIYERKLKDVDLTIAGTAGSLFSDAIVVCTNVEHSQRVWKGLEQKLSVRSRADLYKTFLSELKNIENVLLRFIQYAFSTKGFIENDYSNANVLMVKQTAAKVGREKHRMEAFVRFQRMKDDLYFASIQPDFNVLPLIAKHFKDRYADQRWLIYDAMRRYGIYYDLNEVKEVGFTFSETTENGKNIAVAYDESEALYQLLWKQYFSSVNIGERKNMKLHIQHMPKRYWKHLVEKSKS